MMPKTRNASTFSWSPILAVSMMISLPASAGGPTKVVKTVTVDGQRFKVVWKGDQAEVSRKGMFFKADAKMHLAAVKAAELVSGCRAIDKFTPAIGMVEVVLDCADRRSRIDN
jgi:hypothetical protein